MPLPKDAKVLGQKREKDKLVLYFKSRGKIKKDIRKCKCSNDRKKPCKCK